MEKVRFTFADGSGEDEFFVLEETMINGSTYILVTDSEEDDAECLNHKETGQKLHLLIFKQILKSIINAKSRASVSGRTYNIFRRPKSVLLPKLISDGLCPLQKHGMPVMAGIFFRVLLCRRSHRLPASRYGMNLCPICLNLGQLPLWNFPPARKYRREYLPARSTPQPKPRHFPRNLPQSASPLFLADN